MDPTQRINALRQYMDFYAQNGPQYNSSTSTVYNADQNRAAALRFAQGMADQGDMPDFGAQTQGPAYVPPRSLQDMSREAGFPLAPQDQPPMRPRRPDVNGGDMAMNFLRNLFTRR